MRIKTSQLDKWTVFYTVYHSRNLLLQSFSCIQRIHYCLRCSRLVLLFSRETCTKQMCCTCITDFLPSHFWKQIAIVYMPSNKLPQKIILLFRQLLGRTNCCQQIARLNHIGKTWCSISQLEPLIVNSVCSLNNLTICMSQ